MKKFLYLCMFLVVATTLVIPAGHAYAQTMCVGQEPGATSEEPNLQQQATTPPGQGPGNTLVSNIPNDIENAGINIINAIFTSINSILNGISADFYNGIVGNTNYIDAVNALIVLYITIYGIMILFNLASYRTAEIISRLIKVGILWAVLTDGWQFFYQHVAAPTIIALNEIITNFMVASGQGNINMLDANNNLNPMVVSLLVGVMDLIFSLRFAVMLLCHLLLSSFGWFFVLAMLWGLLELILMLIGAIITYVKAIVGLSFLFGIAPIFLAFILFEQSRRIFIGWVNQVFGFFLQPILLFAFLSFYMVLITNALMGILFATDYCWVKWISFGIFDIYWWRPISYTAPNPPPPGWQAHPLPGNGGYAGDWTGAPPIGITDVAYFLLLTHLGKSLSKFIEQLSRDLSGGHGPGIVRGNDVGRWFSNHIPGVKGRSIGQLGADAFEGAKYRGKNAFTKLAGNRTGPGSNPSPGPSPNSGPKGGPKPFG